MQKKNILLLSCGKQLQEDYAYITMRQVSIAEIKGLYCYNCCLFYVGNAMEAINNRRDGSEIVEMDLKLLVFILGALIYLNLLKYTETKMREKLKMHF